MPSKSLNVASANKRGSSFISESQKRTVRQWVKSSKFYYRKWHLNHLAPIPFITLYMLLGGFFFWWSENGAEFERLVEKRQFYAGIRREFVRGVEVAMQDTDLERGQKRKLLAILVDALLDQLDISVPAELDEEVEEEQEWTFTTAMYFSGTLFTTIGYGDIACETAIGQIGTIVYSIIGIPVMLITLNELGKFLYKIINEFMASLNRKWQKYVAKYWCIKSAPKKPVAKQSLMRKRYSNASEMRQAQKEMERKHTHFFKDQRIAQREIVFDFDRKSVIEELKSGGGGGGGLLSDRSTSLELEPTIDESTRLPRGSTKWDESVMEASMMEEEDIPRMHVLVAITFTVSWVLFCTALFKHVENWSYNRSLYFVCVSLLTVGLGDVKVKRRGYMLLFFAFVMIGLSLVSMCINVIQNSIEDFYKRLLAQMLENLKNGEAEGLSNNWKAKLLLPFLGKRRRASMMRKLREEAGKCGLEIPEDMQKIFEKPKEETEKSDTTNSEFSDFEVEIQPPSEPDEEEPEEEVEDANMLLGIPAGWSQERRPSFQLDDHQMQLIPYADDSLRATEDNSEKERRKKAEELRRPKISVPQLKIVPSVMIVTEEGEQRNVHSIESPNNFLS